MQDVVPSGYLAALVATLVVETAVWVAAAGRARRMRAAATAVAVNVLTHAAGWLAVYPAVERGAGSLAGFVAVEVIAVAVETPAYRFVRRVPVADAVMVVLVANALSMLTGLLV